MTMAVLFHGSVIAAMANSGGKEKLVDLDELLR
jgi:hypothetical protein